MRKFSEQQFYQHGSAVEKVLKKIQDGYDFSFNFMTFIVSHDVYKEKKITEIGLHFKTKVDGVFFEEGVANFGFCKEALFDLGFAFKKMEAETASSCWIAVVENN